MPVIECREKSFRRGGRARAVANLAAGAVWGLLCADLAGWRGRVKLVLLLVIVVAVANIAAQEWTRKAKEVTRG